MNTKVRRKGEDNFEKDSFKLINSSVFGKTMKNVWKHRDIKLVTTGKRRTYLASEPDYHTIKFFTENLLAIEMRKTLIFMNKSVYLGLSILDLSETVMYEFKHDYVKPKYDKKGKNCYTNTSSSIFCIQTNDIHKDTAEDVETRFDISNYELERSLPKGKNKEVIGVMKDELVGKIMKDFVGLRAKTYSSIINRWY